MTFWQKLKSSIYDPPFYQKVPSEGVGTALGYFLKFSLLLTLLSLIFLIKPLLFDFQREMTGLVQKGVDQYPSDLSLTIKNGKVSTTSQQPYFIPFPNDGSDFNDEKLRNLVVIDTKNPYSAGQFATYSAMAWVSSDTLFVKSNNEIKNIDLTKFPDVVIDKSFAQMIAQKISPLFVFFGPVIFVFAGLGLYLLNLSRLLYLFILALLIFMIARIARLNLSYRGIYKIGLHAMTLAFIVEFLVDKLSVFTGFTGISYMFSIITLGVIVLNYRHESELIEKKPVVLQGSRQTKNPSRSRMK